LFEPSREIFRERCPYPVYVIRNYFHLLLIFYPYKSYELHISTFKSLIFKLLNQKLTTNHYPLTTIINSLSSPFGTGLKQKRNYSTLHYQHEKYHFCSLPRLF